MGMNKYTEIVELSTLYEKLKNAEKRGYTKAYYKHLQAIKDLEITDKEVEYNRKQILRKCEIIVLIPKSYREFMKKYPKLSLVRRNYSNEKGA